ncbi:MAG: hypothetical protein Q8P46_10950 [Hyphomicrobiales bacterium]|nr:hypothetical protein [Hyphomicrobiales bacterium]
MLADLLEIQPLLRQPGAADRPGLSLYWARRYFLRGLTRSKTAGDLLSLPVALFPLLDRFIPAPHKIDGANGVYFLGRKSAGTVEAHSIAAAYLGAQR